MSVSPTLVIEQAMQAAQRHQNAGSVDAAAGLYRKVLQLDPNHPDALHFLGVIALRVGQPDVAIGLIKRSIKADPRRAAFHLNLGNLYFKQHRLFDAVSCYNEAIRLEPGSPVAHAHLSIALAKQGHRREAAEEERRALQLAEAQRAASPAPAPAPAPAPTPAAASAPAPAPAPAREAEPVTFMPVAEAEEAAEPPAPDAAFEPTDGEDEAAPYVPPREHAETAEVPAPEPELPPLPVVREESDTYDREPEPEADVAPEAEVAAEAEAVEEPEADAAPGLDVAPESGVAPQPAAAAPGPLDEIELLPVEEDASAPIEVAREERALHEEEHASESAFFEAEARAYAAPPASGEVEAEPAPEAVAAAPAQEPEAQPWQPFTEEDHVESLTAPPPDAGPAALPSAAVEPRETEPEPIEPEWPAVPRAGDEAVAVGEMTTEDAALAEDDSPFWETGPEAAVEAEPAEVEPAEVEPAEAALVEAEPAATAEAVPVEASPHPSPEVATAWDEPPVEAVETVEAETAEAETVEAETVDSPAEVEAEEAEFSAPVAAAEAAQPMIPPVAALGLPPLAPLHSEVVLVLPIALRPLAEAPPQQPPPRMPALPFSQGPVAPQVPPPRPSSRPYVPGPADLFGSVPIEIHKPTAPAAPAQPPQAAAQAAAPDPAPVEVSAEAGADVAESSDEADALEPVAGEAASAADLVEDEPLLLTEDDEATPSDQPTLDAEALTAEEELELAGDEAEAENESPEIEAVPLEVDAEPLEASAAVIGLDLHHLEPLDLDFDDEEGRSGPDDDGPGDRSPPRGDRGDPGAMAFAAPDAATATADPPEVQWGPDAAHRPPPASRPAPGPIGVMAAPQVEPSAAQSDPPPFGASELLKLAPEHADLEAADAEPAAPAALPVASAEIAGPHVPAPADEEYDEILDDEDADEPEVPSADAHPETHPDAPPSGNGKPEHVLGVPAAVMKQVKRKRRRAEFVDYGDLNEVLELHRRGELFLRQRRIEEAVLLFRKVVQRTPQSAKARRDLGAAYLRQGNVEAAVHELQKAIELRPKFGDAYGSLGDAFHLLGKLDDAIRCYRQVLALKPGASKVHSNLLLTLNYHHRQDPRAVFQEHLRWAERHAAPVAHEARPHRNERDPDRPLRIGYVSPDFRRHSVNFFVEPVLARHDREKFVITGYSDVIKPDDVTDQIAARCDFWRDVRGMGDAEVAELVRADEIDILVDLSGHTGSNRMCVFARKPAPVQVTWLGYPNTTGLSTVDYRLTDAVADPPGTTEHLHTEQLVRLPQSFICYSPPAEAPQVSPPPSQAPGSPTAGKVTFGCFNILAKVTPEVMGLWAKIMSVLPGSRLVMKDRVGAFAFPGRRRYVQDIFAYHGIKSHRLELQGKEAGFQKHLEAYSKVDIVLDPFPYNGTTTTCEALWMGVPVVTLAGNRHASRVGASLLTSVGLQELIGESPQDYARKAATLAMDPHRLAFLRSSLRERMEESPLLDDFGFTRSLESEFRNMWRKWCEGADAKQGAPVHQQELHSQ